MEFELAEEHRMLKDLVANFVRDELMPLEAGVMAREAEGKGLGIGLEEQARLDKVTHELGLFGLDAPEDVGGSDLPMTAMVGVEEELGRCVTPYTLPPDSPNLRMLMQTVDERQRVAYLAPYVAGKTISAIGISEPGAGSDLASLTTKATKVDGGWRITGQKIWTTAAQFSKWGALLARTDPSAPKHAGITYFLLDMKQPGVEVKPLRELTGNALFNTVFIDDVFVPDDLVLGEVNHGWEVSRNTLTAERVSIGSDEPWFLPNLTRFLEFVSAGHFDQTGHHRAGELIAEGHAAKLMNMRSTLLTLAGGDAMPSAAISKLLSMRTGQGYAEFAVSSFGTDGAIWEEDSIQGKWAEYLLASRATTIYGGTSEVQLNIIAERLLGLPRDP